MMHRGWIGQPLLAKRKLLPMHLPPARDGPEHETRKARRAAEQFADKPLFREAFARPRQCRKTRAFRRFGEDWGRTVRSREPPERYRNGTRDTGPVNVVTRCLRDRLS